MAGHKEERGPLKRLKDAMRAAFLSPAAQSGHSPTAEQELRAKLNARFPNLFAQSTPSQRGNQKSNLIEDLMAEYANFGPNQVADAKSQLDDLQGVVQKIQETSLNDQDREAAARIARSTGQIQTTLDFIQRKRSSMMPLLNELNYFAWGDGLTKLMDPSLSPADRMAATMSVFERTKRIPGLRDGLSQLSRSGVPGMSQLLEQLLDAGKMRQIQIAASQNKLPDLSSFQDFTYQGLPSRTSIRVLKLVDATGLSSTGSSDNLFRLEDVVVDLNKHPVFNALSYVWGDHRPPLNQGHYRNRAQRCFQILCNNRKTTITYNLFCFFRRLSGEPALHHVRDTPLWIDQLCINQSDEKEKGLQVAMMSRIYSQAQSVVSWLGESDTQTVNAIGLLHRLRSFPSNLAARRDFDVAQFVNNISNDDWLALAAFLSRPYFKRAWIVQEIAMANRLLIICGDRVIPWDDLVDCSRIIDETNAWIMLSPYSSIFQSAEDHMSSSNPKPTPRFGGQLSALLVAQDTIRDCSASPECLLFLGRQFDATVSVDKFYAMAGLARRKFGATIPTGFPTVDYSRSLKETALAFAECHIRTSGTLALLSLVEDPAYRTQGSKDENFPSWLPDPAAPMLPLPLEANKLNAKTFSPWKASVAGLSKERLITKNGSLQVRGHRLDVTSRAAVPFDKVTESDEWFQIFDFLSHLSKVEFVGFKLGEALWRVMTTTTDPFCGKSPSIIDFDQEFGNWCLSLISTIRNPIRKLNKSTTAEVVRLSYSLNDTIFDRLAFGQGAKDMMELGKSPQDKVIRDAEVWLDGLDKFEGRESLKKCEEMASKLRDSLIQLWQLNRDDIFPNPARIHATVEILDPFRQPGPEAKEILARVDTFKAAIGMKLNARRLFFTEDGRMGMGPQSLLEGDEIWALEGTTVPSVLRKSRSGSFRFVGEAYVLGIMHGELAISDDSKLSGVLLE